MAELLVKAQDWSHPDPDTDRLGCYKRGMPVSVQPDGFRWGSAECLPTFVLIKIPGVSVDQVRKYVFPETNLTLVDGEWQDVLYRRRRWQILWSSLPAAARTKLQTTGQLIIKAGTYTGPYDYTWAQVKAYFWDLKTSSAESADL